MLFPSKDDIKEAKEHRAAAGVPARRRGREDMPMNVNSKALSVEQLEAELRRERDRSLH